MIDMKDTMAIILTWPVGQCHVSIPAWLIQHGIDFLDPRAVQTVCCGDQVIAVNRSIRDMFLAGDKSNLIMIENDLRLGDETDAFLEADGDMVCVEYERDNCRPEEGRWDSLSAFHMGMWRSTREVLKNTGPPWMVKVYDKDYCSPHGCICEPLAKQVINRGFTVRHAGKALHGEF